MNQELWESLPIPGRLPLVLLDERLGSLIVARHLASPGSVLHRLFDDRELLRSVVRQKDSLIGSERNLVLNSPKPDLFSYVRKGRLAPTRMDFSSRVPTLFDPITNEHLGIECTPKGIASALSSQRIFPDQFLGYAARSILPGIHALGGTSQQDYLPLFQEILLRTNEEKAFLTDDELRTVGSRSYSSLGGAALVDRCPAVDNVLQQLGPETDLKSFERTITSAPLGLLVGTLGRASYFDQLICEYRGKWGESAARAPQ